MIADFGISSSQYYKIRRGFGGSDSGLESLSALGTRRRRLETLESKTVEVNTSGAHLVGLRDAVQEKVAALWDADKLVDRLQLDKDFKPIEQKTDFVVREQEEESVWAHSHPANVKDIQLTFGIGKGGDPSSVNIVVGVNNQLQPNKLGNTILAAVCPASKGKHEQVSSMLESHLQQLELLTKEGVLVGGCRRAGRLLVSGDYKALCTLHGHKGPSGTMPCIRCCITMSPSAANAVLDEKYGTLQDVAGDQHPRASPHLLETEGAHVGPGPSPPEQRVSEHLSIERMPLLKSDPKQVVPIPLHLTLGGNLRFLRLCVDAVIMCRREDEGKTYALGLAETLRRYVCVLIVPYHGGVFIGRDCHTIASRKHVVTRTLLGILPASDYEAVKVVWELWDKISTTLNRAEMIGQEEAKAFRSNTRTLVASLKNKFPWFNISPKMHILLFHAPDFLDRFGSLGLYGEQGIEAW